MTEITLTTPPDLHLPTPLPLDRHPAAVYGAGVPPGGGVLKEAWRLGIGLPHLSHNSAMPKTCPPGA